MKPRNVAEILLTRLKSLGVEFFFANPGTEFVSVIRGFQELPKETVPRPVLAGHEFQAVSMAYGYYLATGKPQAVMTHSHVGLANAMIGVIGAARMHIPMIVIAGATARNERGEGCRDKMVHWSQDARDPGAMAREYMKWEAEIADGESAAEILDRAYAIASIAPCGPVLIKVSRDILMAESESVAGPVAPSRRFAAGPSLEALNQLQELLNVSRRPLVITNRLGRDPRAAELLIRVSERHALTVATPEDFYMSFPATHAHHAGYRTGSALQEADLVLIFDTEVPWWPLENGPNASARVLHVGDDPHFANLPKRGHRGDFFLNASPRETLLRMLEMSANSSAKPSREAWIERLRVSTPLNEKFNAGSVAEILGQALDEKTVLLNELGLPPAPLRLRHPGNYFRSGSASPLGWGVGCALGLKMAEPEKTVIACVGDGVFYTSPVLPALLTSRQMNAPFVLVILNNGGMKSIARTAREFYPEVPVAAPLTDLNAPEMALEQVALAAQGLPLVARDRDEFRRKLQEAIRFTQDGKGSAILNAILEE